MTTKIIAKIIDKIIRFVLNGKVLNNIVNIMDKILINNIMKINIL